MQLNAKTEMTNEQSLDCTYTSVLTVTLHTSRGDSLDTETGARLNVLSVGVVCACEMQIDTGNVKDQSTIVKNGLSRQ